MAHDLRIVVFVEGSTSQPVRAVQPSLDRTWCATIPSLLSLLDIRRAVPISKLHLVAMDPLTPPMSGSGEPLDALIARELKREEFDIAIVAWDLTPAWDPRAAQCRWVETVALYEHLSNSIHLGPEWTSYAAARHAALTARSTPSARDSIPELKRGAILPVCMSPEFERCLVESEKRVRGALGVSGRNVPDWPAWRIDDVSRGNSELLQRAILATKRLRPVPPAAKRVRGDMRTAKNEWGGYLLQQITADSAGIDAFASSPLGSRLRELLDRRRCDRTSSRRKR